MPEFTRPKQQAGNRRINGTLKACLCLSRAPVREGVGLTFDPWPAILKQQSVICTGLTRKLWKLKSQTEILLQCADRLLSAKRQE